MRGHDARSPVHRVRRIMSPYSQSVVGEGLRPSRGGCGGVFGCSGRLPRLPGGWRNRRPSGGGRVLLQQALEALLVQCGVAQYLGEEAGSDCLSGVKRHDCRATVRVPEERMAALLAHHCEAVAFEGSYHVCAADAG